MSQALYRKWRPSRWEQVVGQPHVVQTLRNALAAGRVGHAYLFAGPRGIGKTTVARLLAKAVNCLNDDPAARPDDECAHCKAVNEGRFLDLIEIDAASNTSVEDVRDLRDKINFSPNQGRYKVYIVDEVHMLSTAAFNALLKTLEEPPPHAIFVLATTEVHKIPATVLSRCQHHEFRRIPTADIVEHLKELAKSEGLKAEPEALHLVARQSTGSLRDAISLLDQLSAAGKTITLELAQTVLGTATSQSVLDLIDALQANDAAAGLDHIHKTLDAGTDPRQFTRQIVDYLRDVLLVRTGNAAQVDATAEARAQMAKHAQGFDSAELLRVIRVFNDAASESRGSWQPSLPLEMAFVEALEGPTSELSSGSSAPAASAPRTASKPAKKSEPKAEAAPPGESTPVEAERASSGLSAQIWADILKAVKEQSPNTNALLNSCKARELREGTLYLGFSSEVLKTKMDKAEHMGLVRAAAQQVLGKSVEVRCVTTTGKQGRLPEDVDSSGMVATAIRLGGEIVDMNELGPSE